MDNSTPRIDGTLLQDYQNRVVRIIGRVEDAGNPNSITFYTPSLSSDNVTVSLGTTPDLQFEKSLWYEVIGKVQDDLSVRVIDIQNFGSNINEKAVAGLVKYSHKAAEIFYT